MHVTRRLKTFPIADERHLAANAVTGELSVLSAAGMAALEVVRLGRADACPRPLLDDLKRRGLVFDGADDEDRAFEAMCQRSWQDFRRGSPRHYTFVVNTHCNFRCPYCFENAAEAPRSTLSDAQVDAAFALIDRFAAHDGTGHPSDIEVFGGEPLLPGSRGVVERLLVRVGERGARASIQTNGYHLRSYLPLLRRHAAQVAQLQVTLDGPPEVHDRRRVLRGGQPTFDRIVAGIEALAAEQLPMRINVRINVDRDNVGQLGAMAAFYEARGWTRDDRFSFVAAPVDDRCGSLGGRIPLLSWPELLQHVLPLSRDSGRGPFDLSVFKTIGYFRHCFDVAQKGLGDAPTFVAKVVYCEAAALKLFAFHPDGRIYPCPEAVGDAALAIGEYAPALRLDRRQARLWSGRTILQRPACRDCSISTFCGGGCVLSALRQNRSMAEPVCDDAHEQLECFVGHLRGGD